MKPGDPFLGYRLLHQVGVGGISEVWAARHEFLGHECALKFLQVHNRSNARLVERAKNEAIALARLRHENLVQVIDAGITPEGVVWMAMPLLRGTNLRDHLARHGRLPMLDALRFARDVCDGARAAHEVGIVHRDLKPENVFLTEEQQIVVLDLGVAKFQDIGMKSTGEGKGALGTVRYMSPEHVSSKRVDHRTDQYSVGIMLYEMLHGEHPFHRNDDGEELDKYQIGVAQVTRQPRPLTEVVPGLPAYIGEVVERAIQKNPDARFASMADFAGAIRSARKRLSAELAAPENVRGDRQAIASGSASAPALGAPPPPPPFVEAATEPAGAGASDAAPSLPKTTIRMADAVPSPARVQPAVASSGSQAPLAAPPAPAALAPSPTAKPVAHVPEATPPPSSTSDDVTAPLPRPSRVPMVVAAIAAGALLAGILQLGLRQRSADHASAAAAAESASTVATSDTSSPAPTAPAPASGASPAAEPPETVVVADEPAANPPAPAIGDAGAKSEPPAARRPASVPRPAGTAAPKPGTSLPDERPRF